LAEEPNKKKNLKKRTPHCSSRRDKMEKKKIREGENQEAFPEVCGNAKKEKSPTQWARSTGELRENKSHGRKEVSKKKTNGRKKERIGPEQSEKVGGERLGENRLEKKKYESCATVGTSIVPQKKKQCGRLGVRDTKGISGGA